MTFTPVVLISVPNSEFRWKGKLGVSGIFDGEHYFILKVLSPQKTELIHGERFSGILTGLIFNLLKNSTIQGFKAMNNSLKSHLENQ